MPSFILYYLFILCNFHDAILWQVRGTHVPLGAHVLAAMNFILIINLKYGVRALLTQGVDGALVMITNHTVAVISRIPRYLSNPRSG